MGPTAHILVVDDVPSVRSILRRGLEMEGHVVSEAGSTAELLELFDKLPVALVTLDRNLGAVDSLGLARQIRSRRNVPVIVITGRSRPSDALGALEDGIDAYIVKPFSVGELLHCVSDVLQRYQALEPAPIARAQRAGSRYSFGAGVLDMPRREMRTPGGAVIPLTEVEREVLSILLHHARRVLSREEIMQMLSGCGGTLLDTHIARLRTKIEPPLQEAPTFVRSVCGMGYVLADRVERSDAEQVSRA